MTDELLDDSIEKNYGTSLVDSLVSLRAEIQRLSFMAADADEAFTDASAYAATEAISSIQRLDAIRQNLYGLTEYVSTVIEQTPKDVCVDFTGIADTLRPRDLCYRLLEVSEDLQKFSSGDLDLF
ncbi:MAG: hypothetical protein AAGH41_07680 [Pseudomonadota bacterium]